VSSAAGATRGGKSRSRCAGGRGATSARNERARVEGKRAAKDKEREREKERKMQRGNSLEGAQFFDRPLTSRYPRE